MTPQEQYEELEALVAETPQTESRLDALMTAAKDDGVPFIWAPEPEERAN